MARHFKSKKTSKVPASRVLKTLGTLEVVKKPALRRATLAHTRALGLSTRRKFFVATKNLLNNSIRLAVARNKSNESLRAELPNALKFERPNSVPVCVRRKVRREVLFASKFAGVGKVKRAKWTAESHISCKG